MDYSIQFTREAVFKAAKMNTGGNFLIILGLWAINQPNANFEQKFWPLSILIAVLTIYVTYLGITFKTNLPESSQKKYEIGYAISTVLMSVAFGLIFVLEGVYYGFMSIPHLVNWVIVVAISEALASYLYHKPKLFLANFIVLNLPIVIWFIFLGTTTSIVFAIVVTCYGPLIFLRVSELTKLKNQTVDLIKSANEREIYLQTFLDLIPAKISWLDSELKYIGLNKQFKESNDLTTNSELIGQKFGAKQPDALITKEIYSFLESDDLLKNCELEININGELRWHLCNFSKQKFAKGVEIFLITIDVNEQKKDQEELENQRQLSDQTSKFASLGEMAAGIAHEINNPLTIVQGSIQLIKTMVRKGDLNDVLLVKHLNKISETNGRIVNIIKGMRDFSRTQNHEIMMYESLNDIVETTLLFCKEKFKSKNVKLEVNLSAEEIQCLCRPQQLNQVLLNFLNNAFDAVMEGSGEKIIQIYVEVDTNFNTLCVSDTGKGFSDIDKIFTPYFTTKGPGKGTGIGLSISQKIAQSHDGYIKAFREKEKTVFKLYLPKV